MLRFNVIKVPRENLTRISRWFTAIEKKITMEVCLKTISNLISV